MNRAYIEISNACNLSCSFCPSPSIKGLRQWMSQELFESTLDSLKGIVEAVYLHVLGEPLLHPQLPEFIQACADRNLRVNLTTNGLMIAKHAQMLLEAATLRQINFSLHALQELPNTDEALVALDNSLTFVKLALARRPDLYINLRLWNEGEAQSATLASWNRKVRQHIETTLQISIPERPFTPRKKNYCLGGRAFLHSDTRFEWPADSQQTEARTRGTCKALETHCAILADGRVVACCLDYKGDLELGHVQKGGVAAALDSPRARAMREGFARNELVEPFCQRCQFCTRFG
ncbi:radical SAM/SPASM domain-containing protein [Pontiellaceae bacterium B12219]|nr:radical SAM/SPASM domain-containing protein [Pontiellaceae bacterium B12219]